MRKRSPLRELGNDLVARVTGLGPLQRQRLAIAAVGLVIAVGAFAACGGCGRRPSGAVDPTSPQASLAAVAARIPPADAGVVALRDGLLWSHAKDGDVEDLAALADQEGAMGLVEAAEEPSLRPTAIRAMAHAQGWAQLPFLVKAAAAKDEEEARLALDATIDLAARPRRAEDPEDADELREGCDALGLLARAETQSKARRIAAIRAVRMMPCPTPRAGAELPSTLDAK